jgi:hypothetical protein
MEAHMDKKYFLYLALTVLVLFSGCIRGGLWKENISPAPTPNVMYTVCPNPVSVPCIRKVAIFPFADYSQQQDAMETNAWGGNIKIQEEIADQLTAHGISIAVQEDVNTLLVDYNLIRPVNDNYLLYGTMQEEDEYSKMGTPQYELKNYEHSAIMQQELRNLINFNTKRQRAESSSPVLQGVTVGLSKDIVMELGQALGVDMIIRGRIIEYGYKDVGTLNPFYRGFIPVLIDGVKDTLYGTTGAYGYEDGLEGIEDILIGSGIGYGIGSQITHSTTHSRSSLSSGIITRPVKSEYTNKNNYALEGAGIGALSGWMTSQRPKKAKRSAVVQVRIYAQDARTGDVLWSNRTEIEYTPCSYFAFSDTHPKVMFDKAAKQGVKVLMDNFFKDARQVLNQGDNQRVAAENISGEN